MRRINIGVIGCGYIAQTAHLSNLLKIPEARLIAVADISEEKLAQVKRRFAIKEFYKDYNRILKNPNIDAVLICTPTHLHAKIAIEAAEAKKHVFCEKPMARTSKEAQEMIKAARENDVKLMIGHFLRFLPNHELAKRYIRDGRIGKPTYVEAHSEVPGPYSLPRTHFFFKKELGGGIILDYGVHLVDLVYWLMDSRILSVGAFIHTFMNLEVENEASLIIRLENNLIGSIKMFWVTWKSWEPIERYIKVLGTEGKIISELTGPSLMIYREGTLLSRILGIQRIIPKELHPKLPGSQYAYKKELEEFINAIIRDKDPPVTGEDGLIAIKVIEAAKESVEKKAIIQINY